MNSCEMIKIFNDKCREDLLSTAEIKNEPKEEPEKLSRAQFALSVNEPQPEFEHTMEVYEHNTSSQDSMEDSHQCSNQDSNIKHEIESVLLIAAPVKLEPEQYPDIQPEERSSDIVESEIVGGKCDLTQGQSCSFSDPLTYLNEEPVCNEESDSHKCIFTYDTSYSHLSNAIIPSEAKRDDITIKTKFCQVCNKSLYIYMCEICKRVFTDEKLIENHMDSHVRERTHTCETCKKSFSSKRVLRTHVIIHTGVQPYSCNVCNKSFNNSSNLSRHVRLHSKDRPYKCEYCYKTFIVKGELKFHIRTHTGERPHQCDICSKTYLRKNYLDTHMKVHRGNTYKCDVCSKSFSRRANLYDHMNIHSKAFTNACEVCNETFATRSSLVKHKKRTHKFI